MASLIIFLLSVLALGCGAGVVYVMMQSNQLKEQLNDAHQHIEALRQIRMQLDAQHEKLQQALQHSRGESRQRSDWLDAQQKDIDWLRRELDSRPKITQKRYRVLTLGIKGTGKTSLTLKWANPLTDLGTLQGTKIERYERTVSHVAGKEVTMEHVFEIGDWGGEHIVDAQQELIMEEVHGLLVVVDLAGPEGQRLDPGRIQEQLREFQHQSLKFFFGSHTLTSCKTVVLFINKSDVLAGTPAEVEQEARHHYKPLIDALDHYRNSIDVRVLVGSASYGHSTHHLFSHFVERILPKNAYDAQLLQRMKQEAVPPPQRLVPPVPPPLHRPTQAPVPPPLAPAAQVPALSAMTQTARLMGPEDRSHVR
jgi:Gtr1/RagA G protein conserved region